MDNINSFIVSEFVAFSKQHAHGNTLGTCDEACTSLLSILHIKQYKHFKSIRVSDIELHIYDQHIKVCEVKKVEGIVVFNCVSKFTRHCHRLYQSLKTIRDETFVQLPCKSVYGEQFEYGLHGCLQKVNTEAFGVGFLHLVLHVKLQDDKHYLLDPSMSQFHDPPNFIIIPKVQ